MNQRLLDLSRLCGSETEGVRVKLQEQLPVYCGHVCEAYDISIRSHTGTYFETAGHLFRDGIMTDQFPLDKLAASGICLRVESERREITAADLEEAARGIEWPSDAGLLIDIGARSPDMPHRYFTRDAARWMVGRGCAFMGANTPLYDTGFENPTGFFVDLFRGGMAIIANLVNLEQLPRVGFTIVVMPLAIRGVCTVPCRVVAGFDL